MRIDIKQLEFIHSTIRRILVWVEEETHEILEAGVNSLIQKGYTPQGGVAVKGAALIQAMVKEMPDSSCEVLAFLEHAKNYL